MGVPYAPVITKPAKGAYTNTASGTDVYVRGTWRSRRSSDRVVAIEVQILSPSATDASPGTPIKRVVALGRTTTDAWNFSSSKWAGRVTGLAHHTQYKIRARIKGIDGWGAFSPLSGQTFYTNALASVTTFAWTTGTLVPTFSARISSPDPGDWISGFNVQVMEDYASGLSIARWDSGKVEVGGAGNTTSLEYAGEALVWGAKIRARAMLWDSSAQVTLWTSWVTVPLVQNAGPDVTPSDTINRLPVTPTWTITRTAQQFDAYQLQAFQTEDLGGAPIYDSGLVSVASTTSANHVATTALPNASSPFIRARVRSTSSPDLGVWSTAVPNYISAAPSAPSSISPGSLSADLAEVVSPTPELSAVYEHPDRDTYGDVPSRREVEIWNESLTTRLYYSYVDSPGYTVPMVYTPASLTAEVTYAQRWRFRDALSNTGPWSAWTYFRASYPPTATLVYPA